MTTQSDSDDEYDAAAEKIAHDRLVKRKSQPILLAVQKTIALLIGIGFRSPAPTYLLTGGIATVFFRHRGNNSITFVHQSECAVIATFFKKNEPIKGSGKILWAPLRDPWVIVYLIAGLYRIESAVYELHRYTSMFCKFGNMRRCSVCESSRPAVNPKFSLPKFRLTPLWSEDDEMRAGDKSLDLATVHMERATRRFR